MTFSLGSETGASVTSRRLPELPNVFCAAVLGLELVDESLSEPLPHPAMVMPAEASAATMSVVEVMRSADPVWEHVWFPNQRSFSIAGMSLGAPSHN